MRLTEVTRFTDEVDATIDFYATLLDGGPDTQWAGGAVFDLGGPTLLVHETYEPADDELPPEDHLAFAVADVDGAFERLERRGLTVERPPAEYDWGRSAYLVDPDGTLVEITERD